MADYRNPLGDDIDTRHVLARMLADQQPAEELPSGIFGEWVSRNIGSAHMKPWPYQQWLADPKNVPERYHHALSFMLGPKGALPKEIPTQAALRFGGQTFTGKQHFDALMKAEKAIGRDAFNNLDHVSDGFVTNRGRFVDRHEAARLMGLGSDTELHASTRPGRFGTFTPNVEWGLNGIPGTGEVFVRNAPPSRFPVPINTLAGDQEQ